MAAYGFYRDSLAFAAIFAIAAHRNPDAQEAIRGADAAAFISPVYWEEVSEGLKSFLDRFRRCESSGI